MTASAALSLACPLALAASDTRADPHRQASADAAHEACVDALEQLMTLAVQAPVYMRGPGDARTYLSDADRPRVVASLNIEVEKSCSSVAEVRQTQDAEARRRHVARSPHCRWYLDRLEMLLKPGSRATADDIARVREFIGRVCPTINMESVWLYDPITVPGSSTPSAPGGEDLNLRHAISG